jgi:hypothetical protein
MKKNSSGCKSPEASVGTAKKAMRQVFARMKPCRVAIEGGPILRG